MEKQFHREKRSGKTKGATNDYFIILYLNVYRIRKAGSAGDQGGMGDLEGIILPGVCAAVLNYTADFGTGLYRAAAFGDRSAGQFRGGKGMIGCEGAQ